MIVGTSEEKLLNEFFEVRLPRDAVESWPESFSP